MPARSVTPHSLCWTDECFKGIGASAAASVIAVANGSGPEAKSIVNKQVLLDARFLKSLKPQPRL